MNIAMLAIQVKKKNYILAQGAMHVEVVAQVAEKPSMDKSTSSIIPPSTLLFLIHALPRSSPGFTLKVPSKCGQVKLDTSKLENLNKTPV